MVQLITDHHQGTKTPKTEELGPVSFLGALVPWWFIFSSFQLKGLS
jgi:hypothetical protein